jgi:hypothetical protein
MTISIARPEFHASSIRQPSGLLDDFKRIAIAQGANLIWNSSASAICAHSARQRETAP